MIDIIFNCFNSLNFYIIIFIGFLLFYLNKYRIIDEINKEEKYIIDSSNRRSDECPQQYPNGWLPVCESRDLKKGEIKSIFALGRDLVIYRGMSGKVYVFDAYCPHLGANLGVGGTVVGDDIKCPFHGWQFNYQGDCNAIPGLDDEKLPRKAIEKYRCDEVNDFIYVWHHLDQKEPDWFIPKVDKFDDYIYRGKISQIVYCHIQDIFENEADLVHFDKVHGSENTIPNFLKNLVNIEVCPSWKISDPPNNHCSNFDSTFKLKIGAWTYSKTNYNQHIGPVVYLTTLGTPLTRFKIHLDLNVITLGPMKQLMIYRAFSKRSVLGLLFCRFLLASFHFLIKQDVPIWNRKKYSSRPTFTKLDETIIQFRRWYKQFYLLNSNDYEINH